MIDLERITWVDSGKMYAFGWTPVAAVREVAAGWNGQSSTTGYTVYEDEQVVVLVQTLDDESSIVSGAFLIYKPCIVHRVMLERREWKHG